MTAIHTFWALFNAQTRLIHVTFLDRITEFPCHGNVYSIPFSVNGSAINYPQIKEIWSIRLWDPGSLRREKIDTAILAILGGGKRSKIWEHFHSKLMCHRWQRFWVALCTQQTRFWRHGRDFGAQTVSCGSVGIISGFTRIESIYYELKF